MNHPTAHESGRSGPRTWLLLGDKLGDNAQVDVVAERLGWPCEVRRLEFLPEWRLGKPRFRPSLFHVDLEHSDALAPPWPDLVITVGRRPAMAALWIQKQSEGATRLVLIGRPKRWLDRFDLVVAPPQYRLPIRDNIHRIRLPLMRVDGARVEAARSIWEPRLADLRRPLTAVLVGGQTQPFRFDAAAARDLVRRSMEVADGGSLYVTTSRRTGADVEDALEAELPDPSRLFRFRPDAGESNPYLGLLACADRFIVTQDSISMMIEVARLGKPLAIYALPMGRSVAGRVRHAAGRVLHGHDAPLGRLGSVLFRLGVVGFSRDLTLVRDELVSLGAAVPLGRPFSECRPVELPDDAAAVAERIRAMFA